MLKLNHLDDSQDMKNSEFEPVVYLNEKLLNQCLFKEIINITKSV